MPRVAALPGRLLIAAVVALILLVCGPERTRAQGQPAVVEGTNELFIRRGPGREFPPFATLTGGSQVQVQERRGTWARISTASGQVGYVHTKFLRLLDTAPVASVTQARTATSLVPPTPTPPATQSPSPQPESTQPLSPRRTSTHRRSTPTAAVAQETEPTVVETTEVSTPTATRTVGVEVVARSGRRDMQSEIDRLSNAVEALNTRLDQRFPLPEEIPAAVADSGTGVSGGAILVGVLGVIVGWLMGATYQRNKDRGRRARIRL